MIQVFRVANAIVSVYMILIFVRIIMSWFSSPTWGAPIQALHRITEPYLSLFRRIPYLRTERLDFSPIAAIIVLSVFSRILNRLAYYGELTVGIILAIVVSSLWSAASFLLIFLIILASIRFFALASKVSSENPIWNTIDIILNPFLQFVQKKIFVDRQMSYQMGLGLSGLVFLATAIAGHLFFIRLIVARLELTPF